MFARVGRSVKRKEHPVVVLSSPFPFSPPPFPRDMVSTLLFFNSLPGNQEKSEYLLVLFILLFVKSTIFADDKTSRISESVASISR